MTIILAIGHTAPFFGPCGLRTNWCSQKPDGKCCTQLTLIFLLKTGRHGMGAPGAYTYVLIRRWNWLNGSCMLWMPAWGWDCERFWQQCRFRGQNWQCNWLTSVQFVSCWDWSWLQWLWLSIFDYRHGRHQLTTAESAETAQDKDLLTQVRVSAKLNQSQYWFSGFWLMCSNSRGCQNQQWKERQKQAEWGPSDRTCLMSKKMGGQYVIDRLLILSGSHVLLCTESL